MTILSTAKHLPVAPAKEPRSASQVADELSVLKANVDNALELMYSDEPEEREQGEAMLQAIVDRESDLRRLCNNIIRSSMIDDQKAAGFAGTLAEMKAQRDRVEAQQKRYSDKAKAKRVWAAALLDHHFPDEKTHPTDYGNIKFVKVKPAVVSKSGGKLGIKDIPEDYEWLISAQEVTTTKKVIDEQKILELIARGDSVPFARLKENTTRFY